MNDEDRPEIHLLGVEEYIHAATKRDEERLARTPTLRDQFAMAALQGDLAGRTGSYLLFELAESAYHTADAMMEARKK